MHQALERDPVRQRPRQPNQFNSTLLYCDK